MEILWAILVCRAPITWHEGFVGSFLSVYDTTSISSSARIVERGKVLVSKGPIILVSL